jgi:hypothetical protein
VWKRVLVSAALVACEKSAPPPVPLADTDLAVVSSPLADLPGPPIVTVSKTAVLVGGKPVVPIANGKVDAVDKEGGAFGFKLPKLLTVLAAQAKQDTLVLALDRTTPYQLLISVMFTAQSKPAAYRRFAIVARAAATNAPTALIVNVPDTPPAAAVVVGRASTGGAQLGDVQPHGPSGRVTGGEPPRSLPLQLVVSASSTELRLWSMSSAAGTLQAPKLRIPLADAEAPVKLRAALAEVATQSFSGPPPEDQRAIIFMGSQSMQAATFIPVMAAMQSVFPDLLLSVAVE